LVGVSNGSIKMPPNGKCATYKIIGIENNGQNGNQFIIKPRNYIMLT
jgi:hypothetical protein